MKIAHIDKLIVRSRLNEVGPMRNLELLLSPHSTLVNWQANHDASDGYQRVENLFEINLPRVGPALFKRVWSFFVSSDRLNAKAVCSFRIAILLEESLPDPDNWSAEIRSSLVVTSIFTRQRLGVVGWSSADKFGFRQDVFHQPLTPVQTDKASFGANIPIVAIEDFSRTLNAANTEYGALEDDYKILIDSIGMGLVPYMKQSTSERFLSMFHALEQCRSFAIQEPTADMAILNDQLVAALTGAQATVDESNKSRIDGFIEKVNESTVDLKNQIEDILSRWQVVRYDLWPFFGTKKNPGLKQIRDRLSHIGSSSIDSNSLVVACAHLAVLLERIVLCLLKINISETDVSPQALATDDWFSRATVVNERRDIFIHRS